MAKGFHSTANLDNEPSLKLKTSTLFLLAVYLLAHIWILLLHEAVFWDDWTLFGASPSVIVEKFEMAGSPFSWVGHLHVILSGLPLLSYRLIALIAYLFSGYFLMRVLRERQEFGAASVVIAALYLLAPFNSARVAAINLPYALCNVAFFLAWWQMGRRPNFSILLFVFSFNTPSFLVLYAIPFLEYSSRKFGSRFFFSKKFYAGNYIFIALPFLFWFLKIYFFPPSGLFIGYNEGFSLDKMFYAIGLQYKELRELDLQLGWRSCFVWLSCTAVIIIIIRILKTPVFDLYSARFIFLLVVFGVVTLGFAMFPYLILGYPPRFYSWDSRHQLLMPLGFSLVVAAAIFSVPNWLARLFVSSIIGLLIVFWIIQYKNYYIDYKKQEAIMRAISGNDHIKQARLVVFEDCTGVPNANGRSLAYYEWNGMMANLYGDETRFGIEQIQWTNSVCNVNDPKFSFHYRAGGVEGNLHGGIVLVKLYRDEFEEGGGDRRFRFNPRFKAVVEPGQDYCERLLR